MKLSSHALRKAISFWLVFAAFLNPQCCILSAFAHKKTAKANSSENTAAFLESRPSHETEANPKAPADWLRAVVSGREMPFLPHTGAGTMQNYLAMNLPFEPAQLLKKNIEKTQNLKLKDRGEAHITVITPVEYDQVLRPFLTIAEINQIATSQNIQQARVEPVCIGSFKKNSRAAQPNVSTHASNEVTLRNIQTPQVFFVVVQSEDLMEIRKAVQTLFEERGGKAKEFEAADFEPHITLGFTDRDLHRADGAVKTAASCLETHPTGN